MGRKRSSKQHIGLTASSSSSSSSPTSSPSSSSPVSNFSYIKRWGTEDVIKFITFIAGKHQLETWSIRLEKFNNVDGAQLASWDLQRFVDAIHGSTKSPIDAATTSIAAKLHEETRQL